MATAANWLAAFPLVAQFFLSLVDAIVESTTFFLFAALCVVSFVFVRHLVPETKGRSLEEIQERWVKNGDRMLDESDPYTRPPGPNASIPPLWFALIGWGIASSVVSIALATLRSDNVPYSATTIVPSPLRV